MLFSEAKSTSAQNATALCDLNPTRKKKKMKTMLCKQLGGACEKEFHANTFEEIAELSKQHGVEMYQKQDAAHLEAMQQMQELMKNPGKLNKWFESKRKDFGSLPER